jgi:GMP synthase (glutamine-hydrolysing)
MPYHTLKGVTAGIGMHIHYLQHVPFEGLGYIEQWTIEHNHSLSATKFYQNDRLPNITEFDCLIVLGGPMNVYEEDKYPWLKMEKGFIQATIAANKTIVGICLGAQLIATVLGARVYPGEYKEMGWFPVEFTPFAQTWGLPPRLEVFHWHGDTFDLPPDSIHLASSAGCTNQAFLYGERVLGLQFHLESTAESVAAIIANCSSDLVPGKYSQSGTEMLAFPDRFPQINALMGQILAKLCL